MKRTFILSFLLDDNVSFNTVKTIPCFGTGKILFWVMRFLEQVRRWNGGFVSHNLAHRGTQIGGAAPV